ncbi:MAG: vitamin K epoxide reductase family protein [Acidobacteria bacterium]|nr:vitamin K epoxide reductase family protein [Acidobacteriota bacterium]
MMSASWSLGASAVVEPSGGREVWLSLEGRVAAMRWSDALSGLLLVVFGWRALRPARPISAWICCFVGIWLTMAPIVFWAPSAALYANGTLVGALVIALTVLIPGMPGMVSFMRMGGDQPPEWSYNPSSWPQRAVLIVLAFGGWIFSRHLAAYQLGYVDQPIEPFFGDGSRRVLDSDMSHSWPISDAALGAFAYTIEFLMAWMGGTARWRTMPWMVTFFGILVIPLGLVHIVLVISQPVVVGAWCTFCLAAALLMLPMIPLQVDEVIAMAQNLREARERGESVWVAFWKGGPAESSVTDERTPQMLEITERPASVAASSLWGLTAPWSLTTSALAGLALMFLPAAFALSGPPAHLFHLGGPIVFVIAVVAMGEPVRLVRWLNVPTGLGLAVLPWMTATPLIVAVLATVTGAAIALLAIPRGSIRESYGSWNRFVR